MLKIGVRKGAWIVTRLLWFVLDIIDPLLGNFDQEVKRNGKAKE